MVFLLISERIADRIKTYISDPAVTFVDALNSQSS